MCCRVLQGLGLGSRSKHLSVGGLGGDLQNHSPVSTVETPIRNLLPVTASGFVHEVIEPPAASPGFATT